MSLFYSQNSEDVLLARCFEGQTTGFYVDVGAEDPVEGSITKYFYDLGWHGINIEPVPEFFHRIQAERQRDINLQCVASEYDGESMSLLVAEGTGLSSLEPNRQNTLRALEKKVQSIEVKSQSLNTILAKQNIQSIDFLKIDVEGHELAVLQGLNLKRHHPRVIVVETTLPLVHPGGWVGMKERPQAAKDTADINQLITAAGYRKIYFDGLNTWWIDEAEPALAEAFQTPANCFDTISPMEHHRIIGSLNTTIQTTDETLAETKAQCVGLQHDLDATQKALAKLLEEHQNLHKQQQALLNSRSWKLTAPLRRLLKKLEAVRGNPQT